MEAAKDVCSKCYYCCYTPEMVEEIEQKEEVVEPEQTDAPVKCSTAADGDEIAASVNEFSIKLLLQVLKHIGTSQTNILPDHLPIVLICLTTHELFCWFAEGTVCVAPLSIAVARAMFLIGWTSNSQLELQRSLELLGWTQYKHTWSWSPVPVEHVKRAVAVVNHQTNLLKPLGVTYRPNFVTRLDHVFMVRQFWSLRQ